MTWVRPVARLDLATQFKPDAMSVLQSSTRRVVSTQPIAWRILVERVRFRAMEAACN